MLVLTRKPNQQLHIGNDIVITIVKVRGNTIRLGIEAPKDVRVIRSELEPKPAAGSHAPSDPLTSASATEPGDQPEAAASSDDAQEAADAEVISAEPVVFQARVKAAGSIASPLKRFATAMRSQGAYAERNLEDCPLCHRASPESASNAQRPSGLHSYIASKSRSGALEQSAPRDQQGTAKSVQGKPVQGKPAQCTHAQGRHAQCKMTPSGVQALSAQA